MMEEKRVMGVYVHSLCASVCLTGIYDVICDHTSFGTKKNACRHVGGKFSLWRGGVGVGNR